MNLLFSNPHLIHSSINKQTTSKGRRHSVERETGIIDRDARGRVRVGSSLLGALTDTELGEVAQLLGGHRLH